MSETNSSSPAPVPVPAAPPPPPERVIPYERFAEVVGERNTFKARADEADAHKAALDTERAGRAADKAAWEDERSLMQRGLVDPEAIEVARYLHGRLPAEGRPKLAEWVATFAADPARAPVALRGYLGQPGKVAAPPAGSSNVQPPPPAGADVTADQVRAARQHGERTGDWSQYRALRPALGLGSVAPAAK